MARNGIVIIGNYGTTNVGDEAVLAGLLILAKARKENLSVTVLSYDPARTEKEHSCASAPLLPFGLRSFLRFDWWRSFRILSSSREVWIGGGALFTDEKLFAIFLWGWHVLWGRILSRQVRLVANTVGPIRTSLGRFLMRMIVPMIYTASTRDAESEAVLRSLGFEGRITVGADPALLIEPIARGENNPKTIIVSLRPWIRETPGLLDDLADWIDARVGEGYRVTLLPFQTMHDDDRTVLSDLYARLRMKPGVELVMLAEDLPKILGRLASAELVVGMRLHSLILSTVQATPFIGLSYSDKVSNFCRSVGQEESCFELAKWDQNKFDLQAAKLLADTEGIRLALARTRDLVRQAALSLSPESQEA